MCDAGLHFGEHGGITGAAVGKHVQPGEKEYDRFRRFKLM